MFNFMFVMITISKRRLPPMVWEQEVLKAEGRVAPGQQKEMPRCSFRRVMVRTRKAAEGVSNHFALRYGNQVLGASVCNLSREPAACKHRTLGPRLDSSLSWRLSSNSLRSKHLASTALKKVT